MMRVIVTSVCILGAVVVQPASALRLYFIGNSVTDGINYGGVQAMATDAGYTHVWGRQMIPGAPLSWLWEHPTDGFTETPYGYPTNAFPNYTWDAVSLQPFDRHIEGSDGDRVMGGNFINLAKGNSPDVQIYIYMRWPRKPDGGTLDAARWAGLWDRTFTGGWDGTNESRDFNNRLCLALREDHTDIKAVLMVPIGDVMYEFNTRAQNGQISGYSSAWDLYSDGIHLTGAGSYLAGLTMFTTLYAHDPRGSSVPTQYGSIETGLRNTIQNIVWSVVSTHTYSGVSGSVSTARPAVAARSTHPAGAALRWYRLNGRRAGPHDAPVHHGVHIGRGIDATTLRYVTEPLPR